MLRLLRCKYNIKLLTKNYLLLDKYIRLLFLDSYFYTDRYYFLLRKFLTNSQKIIKWHQLIVVTLQGFRAIRIDWIYNYCIFNIYGSRRWTISISSRYCICCCNYWLFYFGRNNCWSYIFEEIIPLFYFIFKTWKVNLWFMLYYPIHFKQIKLLKSKIKLSESYYM